MGVSHVKEELDESYTDIWIGEMDMDARYMNTLIPDVNEDVNENNVSSPVMMAEAVLYDQASHRREVIWRGEPMDDRLLPYMEAAIFSHLVRVQWLRLDKPLITALVEKWRSDPNTFHLTYSEMTITLEDVSILLGLRIDDLALTDSTGRD
ncbi:hypothetical protein H6P81_002746 [Aristolochia fimbriata]|uniref:Aminotransferase-like plant mobile domain-containing protein n=1 Tax=Aristolochia fimbriata TaxID=158543 RepID=A0AAV7FF63_ARIFI|nr:hypothetical protein H6P81_002746 [Aristolochia fimbriata]